jgi:hypothetical protein
MAVARIQHSYPDGSTTCIEVEVGEDFPDACAEVVAQALRLWREAVPDVEASE